MLHRIAWDCKLPSMLFQASLFRRFQQIMESMDTNHKELVKLAKYIIQKFTELAASNKKLLLELLFFKTAREAYEIECGYGSFQDKSKSAKLVWEEHEEDELKRLHEEYMKTKPSENLLDWIMDNIINKDRSKRSIKKKLKELNLLNEEKEKDWTDEQKDELKRLYEEFKDFEDPVSNILEKLVTKRSKRNIASTLLKIGCVDSTKALRKKRKKLISGSKNKDYSESDVSSSEDEELCIQETKEEIRSRESIPELIDTFSLILKQLDIDTYLLEGLQWVKSCLQECVEDIDDEPTEVPLLPLSNEAMLSIENKVFQQFLLSLGIFRPLQQEMYWRFPSTWNEIDFHRRQNLINLIIENREIEECFETATKLIKEITGVSYTTPKLNSDSEIEQSSLNRTVERLGEDHEYGLSASKENYNINKDENELKEIKLFKGKGAARKSRILSETESDDELKVEVDYELKHTEGNEINNVKFSNSTRKEKSFPEFYSAVETYLESDDSGDQGLGSKAIHNKRMRLLDSDSDDKTLHFEKKRRNIILSDDDDDN